MKSTPDINTRNSSEQQRAADPLALTEARLVDGYAGIGMTTISDEYLAQLRAKKLIADALSMTRNSVIAFEVAQ